VRVNKRSISN